MCHKNLTPPHISSNWTPKIKPALKSYPLPSKITATHPHNPEKSKKTFFTR